MSNHSFNDTFKNQNKKLIRATFKKAVVNQVYINSATADVYFAGNPQTIIKGIPLAANIQPSQVMTGDKCRVDVFDETNPSDMVVAYIYGRNAGTGSKTSSGAAEFQASGSNPQTFPHNLGVVPTSYGLEQTNAMVYSGETWTLQIISVDATNITVFSYPDNSKFLLFNWWTTFTAS